MTSIAAASAYNQAATVNAWAQTLQLSALGQVPDVLGVIAQNAAARTQNNDFAQFVDALQQLSKIPDGFPANVVREFAHLILLRTVGA